MWTTCVYLQHDDVIKWKHFPRYWPFVRGIHRSPENSPHKGQWRGALMFSLICAWINGWINNRKAGDLRRYRAHYGVRCWMAYGTAYLYSLSYSTIFIFFVGEDLSCFAFPVRYLKKSTCSSLCNDLGDSCLFVLRIIVYSTWMGMKEFQGNSKLFYVYLLVLFFPIAVTYFNILFSNMYWTAWLIHEIRVISTTQAPIHFHIYIFSISADVKLFTSSSASKFLQTMPWFAWNCSRKYLLDLVNSQWPSDAIWRYRLGPTLA